MADIGAGGRQPERTPDRNVPEPRDLGPPQVDLASPHPGATYDYTRDREAARARLATGSLVLLGLVLGLVGLPVAVGSREWADMEGVAAALLPATLSVVGAAVGFYFGSGSSR